MHVTTYVALSRDEIINTSVTRVIATTARAYEQANEIVRFELLFM